MRSDCIPCISTKERDRPMSKNSKEFDNFTFSPETPTKTSYYVSDDGWNSYEKYEDALDEAKRLADRERCDQEIFEKVMTLKSTVKYPVPDYEVVNHG